VLSLIWGAFLTALCLIGASLATRGEFTLRRGQPDEVRLWLIRDEVNQGLGFSSARSVERGQPQGSECYQTRVRFFLWRSDGSEPAGAYCQCFHRSASGWESLGPCPENEGG
jgi:hypothetical protein